MIPCRPHIILRHNIDGCVDNCILLPITDYSFPQYDEITIDFRR